jgi:CO/xanthine dehydrogenase FAD-binding subunit
MRPQSFELERPQTLAAALASLQAAPTAYCLLAGGQSVLKQLRERSIAPERVIDISAVRELNFVRRDPEGLAIGALVSLSTLVTHPLVRSHCPALMEASSRVGDVQIRSRATFGGNLCSGWASDLGVVVAAARATVEIIRYDGSRAIGGDEFVRTGEQAGTRRELVQRITMPFATGSAFEKLSRRAADPALASAAAFVWRRGDRIDIGLAAGGVHAYPLRLKDVETALTASLSREDLAHALAQCTTTLTPPTTPHGSAEYRRQVFPVLVTRALRRALAQAGCGDLI